MVAVTLVVVCDAYPQGVGPATLTPSVPTATDPIRATFTIDSNCIALVHTSISGNVIRTTVSLGGCNFGPPVATLRTSTVFGPLPPGAYTYELYRVFERPPELVSTQVLVVVPSVPSLSRHALIALSLVLAGIAVLTLRN
jgi:hypothetical protein